MIRIYKVNKNKEIIGFEDLRANSFCGSFLFWTKMEDKYLEPDYREIKGFVPLYSEPISRLVHPAKKASEIWNLVDDKRLAIEERIIMATTFDYCIIKKEYFSIIITLFSSKYATNVMSSISESFTRLLNEDDCIGAAICWNTVMDLYGCMCDENDEEYYPSLDKNYQGYIENLWQLFENENDYSELLI